MQRFETVKGRGLAVMALAIWSALAPPVARAADPIFDAKGFSPNREFASELPFEHVDPLTGNLLLTFTDLVLPGGGGLDLRVQRTYNIKIYAGYDNIGPPVVGAVGALGVGWTLHFGRVLNPTTSLTPGPVIEMPDGSAHPSYAHRVGPADFTKFMTRDYWTYDRNGAVPVLRLPNGVQYVFGQSGGVEGTLYASEISDPFGNKLEIAYSNVDPTHVSSVTQRFASGEHRTVTFSYQGARLSSMTFGQRTWTFGYQTVNGRPLLHTVQQPTAPPWVFDYHDETGIVRPYLLRKVTTPNGGQIDYEYQAQLFLYGSGAVYTPALLTRTTSGPGLVGGQWTYTFTQGQPPAPPTPFDPIVATVTSPCARTVYTVNPIASTGDGDAWRIGTMASKQILPPGGGAALESESFDWVASVPISENASHLGDPTHAALLRSRTVVRAGQTYTTTHTYDTTDYSPTRARNFNDYGRPIRTDESGQLTRATQRAYAYPAGGEPGFSNAYIVDKLDTETVTVGTEAFTKDYDYNLQTGFMTRQSLFGIVTTFTPDRNGSVASRRDARGNTTRFDWLWGVPKTMQTPAYSVTRQVASDSTITSQTQRSFTTGFSYDELFRLKRTDHPVGFASEIAYSADGRSMTATRGASSVTSTLDGFGRVVATANSLPVPVRTRVAYDACGRKTYESYPFTTADIGSTYFHDALDRLLEKRNPDYTPANHSATVYSHSGLNVSITDEELRQTDQVFQAFGEPREARLASVTDAGSGAGDARRTTSYQYNAVGSLTQVTPPVGGLRRWVYDASNLLRQEIHPENGTVVYDYYPNGLVRTRTDPQFGASLFDYDGNNRLVSIDRPGSYPDTQIRYDNSDNRTLLVHGNVTSTFEPYDGNNNLLGRKDRIAIRTFSAAYAYDANDRLQRITYPSGAQVGYGYDAAGRITAVNDGGAFQYASSFQYHPSGGITSYVTNNGVTHGLSYDPMRYWIAGTSTARGATGLTSTSYGHDLAGNVTSLSDQRLGALTLGYDKVDRLKTTSGPIAAAFTYDSIGNRLSKTIAGSTTNYTYNAGTNRLDVSSGAEPASFGYDLNGNATSDGAATYTFDADNMLAAATPAGGPTTTYAYDGDQLRKLRQSGSSSTYFIHGPGGQLLSEYQTVGSDVRPVREYVTAGSRLIASVRPPVLTATPGELNYAVVLNSGASAAQTLTIETTGTVLPWQAQASAGWILLSATSGSTPATINVSVNPAGLQVGTYTGTITLSATGALGSPRAVTLRMSVAPTPGLVVLPRPLRFLAVDGVQDVLQQPLSVLHAGTPSAVTWSATSNATWLSLGPASGTTPSNVQAQVNPSGLAPGTHRAAVTVTAPGAQGSPKLVPVELVVQPGPGATCDGTDYFCEPFDGLASGALGGQAGWTSEHPESAEVTFDPRGHGRALLIEPPPDGITNEAHEFSAAVVINGTEVAAQIMTDEVAPDAQQVAKLEFFTVSGVAWGKTGRTYGALRFGSKIYLQYGPSIYKVLVDQVESGRFYDVRVVYQSGRVSAYVDGQQLFSTTNPVPDSYAPSGFAITGWDRGTGQAYIDLIEGRRVKAGLVVEPTPLRLSKPPSGSAAPVDPSEKLSDKEPAKPAPASQPTFGRLPLGFEPNVGQAPAEVSWFARSAGHALWLGRDELVLTAPTSGANEATPPLRLRFPGAAPASIEGIEPLPGMLSYFIGNDPRAWRTGLRRHARVRYTGLYPGVDLEVYAREHALEYDFIVAPGADPAQVRLSLEGARSARVDARGDLVLETAAGEVRQARPLIYQERDGRREQVEGGYVLASAREVAFHLGAYDRRRPLVIDPTLVFSTYLGGESDDAAASLAVDADGSLYVAGTTRSPTLAFVSPGVIGNPLCQGCSQAFVAKFVPSGTALEYLTYIVAQGNVVARALAVDQAGRAHVTGSTSAADFPTAPAGSVIQPALGGGSDAFVLRLDAVGGALEYSTYLGGGGTDEGRGVAVDAAGRAYVAGSTTSTNFPVLQPLPGQGALQGTRDAFVSSIAPTGTALGRSTYLGGSGDDWATDVAFDPTLGTSPLPEKPPGLYVVGLTTSTNFPVSANALKATLAAADRDIFVAKVFATGTTNITYATYLGGAAFEGATCATAPCGPLREVSVAVDALRTAHVASTTASTDFPPPWPAGQVFRRRGFVAGVADGGQRLVYLLNLESVELADIAINSAGALAVTGTTRLLDSSYANFPLVFPVQQASLTGFQWAAVAKVAPNGASVVHSTHLGGTDTSGGDNKTSFGTAIAIDDAGAVYAAGATDFASFITQDALQPQYVPGGLPAFDVFVTKLADADLSDPRQFEVTPPESTTPEEGTSLTASGAPATLVTVKRAGPLDAAASVECRTLAGTATPGQDFVGSVRTLAFAPGVATATCEVELIDDELAEPAEFLTVALANPTGGVLGPLSRAKVVIEDNDGLVRNVKIRDRVQAGGPNWTIAEGIPWLSFSALAGVGPSTVVATADPTGLPPGTYNDFFTVTGDTGDSPQYVEVILKVLP